MDLTLQRVRRLVITEKLDSEVADHCFLIIHTTSGEKLRISLHDWNGEIANEPWNAGCFE